MVRPITGVSTCLVLRTPEIECQQAPNSSGYFHFGYSGCRKNMSAVLPCKVHALFHTDKICCEPLTEWLHFADLRDGQPDYMVYLVKTIQALGVMVNSVCMELAATHQPLQLRAARNKQLTDGIPYMLRNDRLVFSCQRPQFCYNLAPRLMQQARWPNEVPAHVLVTVAFSTMYAKWCCKWFCYTWMPYNVLRGELLVSLDSQTAWLETLFCPLCVCCLTVLRLCSVVIVEHPPF